MSEPYENFTPSFKENETEQFFYKNGEWISCNEESIHALWLVWVSHEKAHRIYEDGFSVFGFIDKTDI